MPNLKRFQIYRRYFDTSAPIVNVSNDSILQHGNKKLAGTIYFFIVINKFSFAHKSSKADLQRILISSVENFTKSANYFK